MAANLTPRNERWGTGAPVAEVDVPVVLERKAALVAVCADGVHAGQALAKVGVHWRAEDLPQHSTLTFSKVRPACAYHLDGKGGQSRLSALVRNDTKPLCKHASGSVVENPQTATIHMLGQISLCVRRVEAVLSFT